MQELEREARSLFVTGGSGVHQLVPPPAERRRAFFEPLVNTLAFPIAPRAHRRQRRVPPPPVWHPCPPPPLPPHLTMHPALEPCVFQAAYLGFVV